MTDYELKLGGGRVVTWTGHDGMSAAQAYANAHPGVTVFAWRDLFAGEWADLTS